MGEPNNITNNYVRQSFYPDDFNFDGANPPIHRNFLPSVSDNDVMFRDTMDYEDTGDYNGDYTGDYALYQGNPSVSHSHPGNVDTMNGQLNPPNHANGSCPLPAPCQPFCDPYSNTTNYAPTDQHLGISMTSNSSISYILTQDPTSSGYVFMKVEYTQLGRISAGDIDKILVLTQREK